MMIRTLTTCCAGGLVRTAVIALTVFAIVACDRPQTPDVPTVSTADRATGAL